MFKIEIYLSLLYSPKLRRNKQKYYNKSLSDNQLNWGITNKSNKIKIKLDNNNQQPLNDCTISIPFLGSKQMQTSETFIHTTLVCLPLEIPEELQSCRYNTYSTFIYFFQFKIQAASSESASSPRTRNPYTSNESSHAFGFTNQGHMILQNQHKLQNTST